MTRRGMTLIEALITCAVVILLMTMVAGFLVPAFKMNTQGAVRSEMQQMASLAINRMVSDLQASSSGGVSLLPPSGTDPTGFAVIRLNGFRDDGSQIWATEAQCYFWFPTQKRLIRKIYPPTPPVLSLGWSDVRPFQLSPGDLLQIANTPNGKEVFLADHVEDFTIQHKGPGLSVTPPISITLKLSQKVAHTERLEQFILERSVTLRNDS